MSYATDEDVLEQDVGVELERRVESAVAVGVGRFVGGGGPEAGPVAREGAIGENADAERMMVAMSAVVGVVVTGVFATGVAVLAV